MSEIVDGKCNCDDCVEQRENEKRHLSWPFYSRCNDYREDVRHGQILKGAEKYPEPFNPKSWTFKQLLEHAMQENVDQAHYIFGLYEKFEELEKDLELQEKESEFWRARTIKAEEKLKELNVLGVYIDEKV